VSLTTRELRPGPLLARRLAAPAAILAAVAGAVWLLRGLIAYPMVRQHQDAAGPLMRTSGRENLLSILTAAPLFEPLSVSERDRLAETATGR
jgi:hypothetical protein